MTRNLSRLRGAVQRNCDISDARYAGDYGLCSFLLKMREYYRWENDLPLPRILPKEEIGDWLRTREQKWDRIEADAFMALPLTPGALDPFDADAANRELLPQGCVYGAGYGRFQKPVFFLGRLLRVEQRAGCTVLVSSREYARELAAPPAMLQGLLERGNLPALHFYFATFDAPRRELFPQALQAYEDFLRRGANDRLWRAVREGKERWLECARGLLALTPSAREEALASLPAASAR